MLTRILPIADRNLILTGYTGPYQPLIGRQAAALLKMPYVNIELQIEERTGLTADEIRSRYGESRLKMVENEVVADAVLHRNAVIRISGQTLMHSHHYERFAETGPVICLVAELDAVLHSLHLALGARYHDPHERGLAIARLQREWAARRLPGIHELNTTYMDEATIVSAVIELWQAVVV
jgi:shikimate kinase